MQRACFSMFIRSPSLSFPRQVVRLSLLTGELIGLYDFSEVRGRILPDHDVFNGIAYDPDANELILTGKYCKWGIPVCCTRSLCRNRLLHGQFEGVAV